MSQTALIEYQRIDPRFREGARDFDAIVTSARRIADDEDAPREARRDLIRRLAADTGNDHVRRILQACEKDVAAGNFANWSELLAYCRFGAAPAGRFLAELHGEPEAVAEALESLATAHALIDRIRFCRSDYTDHHRIYLPADWLTAAGVAPEDLAKRETSPGLRTVFAKVLNGAELLLVRSRERQPGISNLQLRRHARTACWEAERLASRLRTADPLARAVGLAPWERIAAQIIGRLAR